MDVSLGITRSQFAERMLTLNGRGYSLREYPMFVDILNSPWPRRLMRSGRQVSKTTTMGADLTVSVIEEPYTACLYCNSSQAQTRSFSNSKLAPFLHQSPLIYHTFFVGQSVIDNVFEKRLNNYSSIEMSYFCDCADRVRGKSARSMYLDEVQDMVWEAMIDAEECLSAAMDPKMMYAGTSKSTITPLEDLWQRSTMKEWLLPCSGCGKYNRPSRRNIGKTGLICAKCGKPLNTYDGFWYGFSEADKAFVDGYWIPQIIMPMHCCSESKWERLLEKLETYPEAKFDNEVLGLPNGEGEAAVSEDQLRKMCISGLKMADRPTRAQEENSECFVAGIDWGGNGQGMVSRTTIHVFCVDMSPLRYTCVFGKIYDGTMRNMEEMQDLARIVRRFGCRMVFCDGSGRSRMDDLWEFLRGEPEIIPIDYSGNSTSVLKWNEKTKRYAANRTALIDEFFSDIKQGIIRAFDYEQFRPFARDILNVRKERTGEERGVPKDVYRHAANAPDDSLHSMVYGWVGARLNSMRGDFARNMYRPDRFDFDLNG